MTGHALRLLVRPPRRSRLILLTIGALLVAAVCWYIGMDTPHAVSIGVVLLALGVTAVSAAAQETPPWLPEAPAAGDGVRQDVMRLSWSLRPGRRGIPAAGLRRVQRLAHDRLARFGLDATRAADRAPIERALGRHAASVVYPGARPPTLGAVTACLDALERLERVPVQGVPMQEKENNP